MSQRYETPTPAYRPEKPNHVRTGAKVLFFMIVYHAVTWLLYTLFMSPVENQMLGDEHEPAFRWVMFAFSLVTLVIMAIVFAVFYFKNAERKRAYLAATSVELRGADQVGEGVSRYRRLALTEAVLSTLVTAFLWLIPASFYTTALSTSGMGFGYNEAWFLESFFVGVIGLFQPFQNAWVGCLLGLAILFSFHYFGRLLSHKNWFANRIRK